MKGSMAEAMLHVSGYEPPANNATQTRPQQGHTCNMSGNNHLTRRDCGHVQSHSGQGRP
jgi:hypothetical protein